MKNEVSEDDGWHNDFEEFVGDLIKADRELVSGYWCMDTDVKYINIRVDTRDLSYILTADGRGPSSNMKNKFRIVPQTVRNAINAWREKYG